MLAEYTDHLIGEAQAFLDLSMTVTLPIPQTRATGQASYADSTVNYYCRLSCVEALQSALEMDCPLDLDGEAFVGRAIREFVEKLKT